MIDANYFELAIIAIILAGIGVAIWKGGAANPVGTGRLQHSVRIARTEIGKLRDQLEELESGTASKTNIIRLEEKLGEEKGRINELFALLHGINAHMETMQDTMTRKNAVLDALAESVRVMWAELKEHRDDVNRRLVELASIGERVDANRQAIDKLSASLPAFVERQQAMAELAAGTAQKVDGIARQVDRLYDFLVQKGVGS